MAKARIALIGCGIIGNHHYNQFQKCLDIAEIVGFCDIIPERAEELAGFGVDYITTNILE